MANITISDLHLSSDQSINELSQWEMKTVEGGRTPRRRPTRNTSGGTTDSSDTLNNALDNIDNLLSDLRVQLGETMYNLRNELRNI